MPDVNIPVATTLSGTSVPRQVPNVRERELPDELILYHVATDQAFLLNRVSAAIWDQCDGQRSVREIADELVRCLGAPTDVALADVVRTVVRLQQGKLLVIDQPERTCPGGEGRS